MSDVTVDFDMVRLKIVYSHVVYFFIWLSFYGKT